MGPVLNPDSAAGPAVRQAAADAFAACLRRVAATPWPDIPVAVRRRAAMIVADDISAAFSALNEPQVARARQALLARPPDGCASLLAPRSPCVSPYAAATQNALAMRSEEHTSELQSLMRTSYAVFCLQKKTK